MLEKYYNELLKQYCEANDILPREKTVTPLNESKNRFIL